MPALSQLAEKRPVILYFIARNCPCSQIASVHMQRLQDAYADAIHVVGVIDADPDAAGEWRRRAGISFPVVADPFCEIIHAHKVERSMHTTLLAPGGRITKDYPRHSVGSLEDLNAQIALLLSKPAKPISTEGAPVKPTAGCTFPE